MNELKDIFISIIIPVYNTPKDFFQKCVESILNTSYSFYELIIIDDGSTLENSAEYKKLLGKNERIVYFRKENGGVSSARNQGIRMAKGNYITFVDADDIVTPRFLTEAANLAYKYNSDVVIGAMKYDTMQLEPQGTDTELFLPKEKIKSLKKCFLEVPQSDIPHSIMGTPCAKIYKKNIVEKLMFSEKMTHLEDQIFIRRVFDVVETAVIVPDCWYIYNLNDFSAMHSMPPGKYLNNLLPFFEEWELMNEQEKDDEIRTGARVRSILFFYIAVNDIIAQNELSFNEHIKRIDQLYTYKIFFNLANDLPLNCNVSRYEKIKLYLIKKRMKYIIYFLVRIRRMIK